MSNSAAMASSSKTTLAAGAGGVEPQADVVAGLVERERGETSDGGDALVEGVMGGLGEPVIEHGAAREDKAEGALAIARCRSGS